MKVIKYNQFRNIYEGLKSFIENNYDNTNESRRKASMIDIFFRLGLDPFRYSQIYSISKNYWKKDNQFSSILVIIAFRYSRLDNVSINLGEDTELYLKSGIKQMTLISKLKNRKLIK